MSITEFPHPAPCLCPACREVYNRIGRPYGFKIVEATS